MAPSATVVELHVSVKGLDSNPGTASDPLRTIQRAAELAHPGDTVTVHEGIYRERVDPPRGGTSDDSRITFRAAPGERAEIRGSEIVTGWTSESGGIWSVRLPEEMFGPVNPFREEIDGDWFWGENRIHHTADVFIDGSSLFEASSLDGVHHPVGLDAAANPDASLRTWYAEPDDDGTRLWINIGSRDPRESTLEVNVRPACFLPTRHGVDFVTVRGFRMCHAATQWAPPTAAQPGLLGPGWSRGWVIEDNVIHDSRCTGISLGQDGSFGQNEWTRLHVKHGTQRQREVIFRALNAGWSRATVGSHIVRNNTIYNCEQAGICGHLGAIFSEISGNHIFDIHPKAQFNGAEIAGIKLHAPIDTVISDNHVHHVGRGIWIDWQAQGTRLTSNVLYANSSEDIFIEVSHGPCMVDNNVLLSPVSVRNWSQGTAFGHNLLAGRVELDRVLIRFTPYHLPHSTAIAGLMTVQGGDDRWFNNVFVGPVSGVLAQARGGQIDIGDVTHGGGAAKTTPSTGLSVYDGYPLPEDDWCVGLFVDEYTAHIYPSWISGNVYLDGQEPFARETAPMRIASAGQQLTLVAEPGGIFLRVPPRSSWLGIAGSPIDADRLGVAFVPEVPFDGADGSPLRIDTDFVGHPRSIAPTAGPFEHSVPAMPASHLLWASDLS